MKKHTPIYIIITVLIILVAAVLYFNSSMNQVTKSTQLIKSGSSITTSVMATSTASIQPSSTTTEANGAEDIFDGKVLKAVPGTSEYQVQVLDTQKGSLRGVVILNNTNSRYTIVVGKQYNFSTFYNLANNWYDIGRAYGGEILPPSFE